MKEEEYRNGKLIFIGECALREGSLLYTYTAKCTYIEESGSKTVEVYDKNNELIGRTQYDADGNITKIREYEYDENTDSYYISKEIRYYEDGSRKYVITYDEHGNRLSDIRYDSDGNISESYEFEHEYDENGKVLLTKEYIGGRLAFIYENSYRSDGSGDTYISKATTYYSDGTKSVVEYYENGRLLKSQNYDENGDLTRTIVYDDGYILNEKDYDNGKLTFEWEYSQYSDNEMSGTYISKRIEYGSDGSKTVRTFDEDGKMISEISYDANGNIIE